MANVIREREEKFHEVREFVRKYRIQHYATAKQMGISTSAVQAAFTYPTMRSKEWWERAEIAAKAALEAR